MINMMYLVLTALLALNVSKEILEAFVTVNNGLETTKLTLKEKMDQTYETFSKYATENKEKYGAAYNTAAEIQKKASHIIQMIDSTKAQVISVSEGKPFDQVLAGDTVLNLKLVEKKDDYQNITTVMIGSDETHPIDGQFTALRLRTELEQLRDQMLAAVGERNPTLTANITKTFDFPKEKEAGDTGVETTWEVKNFYHVPLAAGVCIMSKLQGDVRNMENETVNYLLGSVEQKSFKFSTLTPMVDPLTSYVTVGGTYKADIFLGAYDPQNKPVVELAKNGTIDTVKMQVIGEKEVLPIGPDGKAKLEIPATGAGERTYAGIVVFHPVGGEEQRFPFREKFEVAAPNLVVSPTKMNVFYRGVENPVEISVAGYSAKDIAPSMTNGSLSKAQQGYIVKPGKENEATVSVSVTNADGTKKSLPGVKFRVKNVPNPAPYFAGKSVSDELIKKSELSAAQYVIAKMENFEFDLKFEIVEFKITMIVSGTPIEKISKGSALSGDMKEMVSKAKPGQKVYIEGIKARGPDGTVRSLGSLAFKVT